MTWLDQLERPGAHGSPLARTQIKPERGSNSRATVRFKAPRCPHLQLHRVGRRVQRLVFVGNIGAKLPDDGSRSGRHRRIARAIVNDAQMPDESAGLDDSLLRPPRTGFAAGGGRDGPVIER